MYYLYLHDATLTLSKHGVKRVRYSKEALEAKKQKEQAKLKDYLVLNEDVLAKACQVTHASIAYQFKAMAHHRREQETWTGLHST